MKVMKNKTVNCFVGDVVMYNDYPCMIVEYIGKTYPYGLVCLEGVKAGQVLDCFANLVVIDKNVTAMLIKKDKVVISSEEGDESCPF